MEAGGGDSNFHPTKACFCIFPQIVLCLKKLFCRWIMMKKNRALSLFRPVLLAFCLALAIYSLSALAPRAESLGNMVESFGDSIGQGLDNLGQQLNRANSSFLNAIDGQNNNGNYEAQMRQYRRMEAARVNELAEATGVSPDVIRKLRADGMTWEEIANRYGINLDSLPPPDPNAAPGSPLQ